MADDIFQKVVDSFLKTAKDIFQSTQPKLFYAKIDDEYNFETKSQSFTVIDGGSVTTLVIDPVYLWHLYPHTEYIHIDGKTPESRTKTIESQTLGVVDYKHVHDISMDLKIPTVDQLPKPGDVVLLVQDFKNNVYYVIDIVKLHTTPPQPTNT
jgi:hypothetical protein